MFGRKASARRPVSGDPNLNARKSGEVNSNVVMIDGKPVRLEQGRPTNIGDYNLLNIEAMRTDRFKLLAFGLASMRTPDHCDVTILCEGQEFYAHRAVLEASSPYFVSMFRSGMKETISGQIEFKDFKSRILDIILRYIYLGEITKLDTEETVKEVFVKAHFIELRELFEYCGKVLQMTVNNETYAELWQLGLNFGHQGLTEKVMAYVHGHITEVLNSTVGLELSYEQVAGLLRFIEGKVYCYDSVLQVIVNWLVHDPKSREKVAREILGLINEKLVTLDCVRGLAANEKVMSCSEEIANRMNEMGVRVLLAVNSACTEEDLERLMIGSKHQPGRFRPRKSVLSEKKAEEA